MSQKFSSDKMFIKKIKKLSKFSYYSLNHHLSVTRVGIKKKKKPLKHHFKKQISLVFLNWDHEYAYRVDFFKRKTSIM